MIDTTTSPSPVSRWTTSRPTRWTSPWAATGAITPAFPGAASVYAICQPATCNPAPINQVGRQRDGLVDIQQPGQHHDAGNGQRYMWFSAPGQSQYFVPVELLTGTVGSTVRLPYVPNSMLMDQTGNNLYFGSSHELMIYSTTSNDSHEAGHRTSPGVVLAVSPPTQTILINDQVRQVFYIYNTAGSVTATFAGAWSTAANGRRIEDALHHRQRCGGAGTTPIPSMSTTRTRAGRPIRYLPASPWYTRNATTWQSRCRA